MIIGMRGHDFGRLTPDALATAIHLAGFAATQLAFTKAFPPPAAQYMTPQALLSIRRAFAAQGIALPVMGCYVSAGDRDAQKREEAQETYAEALRASVSLGALCVGTETTHFSGSEAEREEAYGGLLAFVRAGCAVAEACGATLGIEPVALHTLNTPELTARLLRDAPSPRLGFILDLANLVTPETASHQAQAELLTRCLTLWGERIVALHVKDGIFNAEGVWENRPLGEGLMDWPRLLPRLREALDAPSAYHPGPICALREGVWPGLAAEECRVMRRWVMG